MRKINDGKVLLNSKDITDEPMLKYVSADLKSRLLPTKAERKENRIDCVDEENGLFEVYFHGELETIVRGYAQATKYLQNLVDEEDYYNGNEKVDEMDLSDYEYENV